MKAKGISVVMVVAAVVLLVVFLPVKPGDVPPAIKDDALISDKSSVNVGSVAESTTEVEDFSTIELSTEGGDTPSVEDSSLLVSEEGVNYYIDENGTKHFVLNASDTPGLGG